MSKSNVVLAAVVQLSLTHTIKNKNTAPIGLLFRFRHCS